jgi:hypothetical protein
MVAQRMESVIETRVENRGLRLVGAIIDNDEGQLPLLELRGGVGGLALRPCLELVPMPTPQAEHPADDRVL